MAWTRILCRDKEGTRTLGGGDNIRITKLSEKQPEIEKIVIEGTPSRSATVDCTY